METQALAFTLQQGVAVAVCIGVAGIFGAAVRALFKSAADERRDHTAQLAAAAVECREERRADRAEMLAQLAEHARQLAAMASTLDGHTRAVERLVDRVTISPVRAA